MGISKKSGIVNSLFEHRVLSAFPVAIFGAHLAPSTMILVPSLSPHQVTTCWYYLYYEDFNIDLLCWFDQEMDMTSTLEIGIHHVSGHVCTPSHLATGPSRYLSELRLQLSWSKAASSVADVK